MRNSIHPFFLFFFALLLATASEAIAKPGKCDCQSGCGMITQGLSADVAVLVANARKEGRDPVSCIRTQACQDRLRLCYEERCGQVGRAAKVSKHKDGKACDFPPRNESPLRRLWKRLTLPYIRDLLHPPKHGGGLHVYTLKYQKPGSDQVAKPNVKTNFNLGSSGSAARAPAADHEALDNGKYACPQGLKSICGSTKDTPWCKSWIQSGRTPGCY